MSQANYSVERILQLVRASFKKQMGDLSCKIFHERLWGELEAITDPGVVKPLPHQNYSYQRYLFEQAPIALRNAATEGFFYLLNAGYISPQPTNDFINFPLRSDSYRWTERGLQWVKGAEPIPEEVAGYMKFLRKHVGTLDDVIEQYILEALTAFNREAFFAAAVMVGAASEKAVYLLTASLLNALKPSRRRTTLETALSKRQLFALLDCVRKTIEDCSAGNPALIPYSATEGASAHLASLFEAIRTQRNDAVHPMNATVSASSVRLLLHSFPYALNATEKLRAWFDANPGSL
ncbi:MAG TPA: hypothetical protein VMU57_02630 [Edaphobacter sp.]|uniref:hypothetical protein n=1 Tax=Edaphobacter sp. TaxID=1934404 RepID=UPI002B706BB0|nr:hypothetical protein [Edaphobacter sp.]HUZ93785.1 hypothetical protein [Edaphobacter sp.]